MTTAEIQGDQQEWVESPEGWNHDPSDDVKQESEEDEEACFDLFAQTDPRATFKFQVERQSEGDSNENENRIVATIELEGFALDSDETAKSTGVTLWEAAPRLARYLQHPNVVHQHIVGRTVLEMGAGLGLCGMVAHHLGAASTVLSDGDIHALRQLRINIKHNFAESKKPTVPVASGSSAKIECRQLIWGSEAQIASLLITYDGGFDTILGADVIYTQTSTGPLMDTVVALLRKPMGCFILSRHTRWNAVSDEFVLEAAQTRGLMCTKADEGIFVFRTQQGMDL